MIGPYGLVNKTTEIDGVPIGVVKAHIHRAPGACRRRLYDLRAQAQHLFIGFVHVLYGKGKADIPVLALFKGSVVIQGQRGFFRQEGLVHGIIYGIGYPQQLFIKRGQPGYIIC